MEDTEKVVTMVDVLQQQQEFEKDADAVLGACDDKDCTYTKVRINFFYLFYNGSFIKHSK